MLKEKTLNGLLYINFLLLPPPLEINGHTNVERKTIKGLLSNIFLLPQPLQMNGHRNVERKNNKKDFSSNSNIHPFCRFHRIMSTLVPYSDQLDILAPKRCNSLVRA